MNWESLLLAERFGIQSGNPALDIQKRSEFQRDYDRLIFSSPFRRLQGKTQVFPLPSRVFVHNRLTHSLEVASIGRSLGDIVSENINKKKESNNPDIIHSLGAVVAAACLAHDMGNPPFGHSGEKAISRFFTEGKGNDYKTLLNAEQWLNFTNFEGNANVLRLLTHQFNGRRMGGFNLTYATLAALLKYPWNALYMNENSKTKYGVFFSEAETFLDIGKKTQLINKPENTSAFQRHPLAFLVEAADDISYLIMDLEDAHKLGIVSTEKTNDILFQFIDNSVDYNLITKITNTFKQLKDKNEQIAYLRAIIINKLIMESAQVFIDRYDEIMKGMLNSPLSDLLNNKTKSALDYCRDYAIENIYNHPSVIKIELAGYNILDTILNEFTNAILNPSYNYSKKVLKLVPSQFKTETDNNAGKLQSIIDFVAGMTDNFAYELYRNIKGIDNN